MLLTITTWWKYQKKLYQNGGGWWTLLKSMVVRPVVAVPVDEWSMWPRVDGIPNIHPPSPPSPPWFQKFSKSWALLPLRIHISLVFPTPHQPRGQTLAPIRYCSKRWPHGSGWAELKSLRELFFPRPIIDPADPRDRKQGSCSCDLIKKKRLLKTPRVSYLAIAILSN